MKHSRVSEVELAGGLKWRQEETWIGARMGPFFARKGITFKEPRHRPARAVTVVDIASPRCEPRSAKKYPGPTLDVKPAGSQRCRPGPSRRST